MLLTDIIESLPHHQLSDGAVGNSDYIDRVDPENVPFPVCQGKDYYGRWYILVKARQGERKFFQTFFKRYNDSNLVAGCKSHMTSHTGFMDTTGGMGESQQEYLIKLIREGFNQVTEEQADNLKLKSFTGEYFTKLVIDTEDTNNIELR